MNWYYADAGQQKGPVSDMEFTTLIRDGRVNAETLVWKEGQPDWQPLGKVRPDLLEAPPAAPAFAPPVMGARTLPGQEKDLYVQQVREGAITPGVGQQGGLRYAGFWIRFAAKLIDWIILIIPSLLIQEGIYMVFGVTSQQLQAMDQANMGAVFGAIALSSLVNISIWLAYESLLVWKKGATLGKMAVGIKVVQPSGEPVGFGRALGRAAAEIINGFTCYLSYLIVAFDEPEKRAIHDHICSTRVIYK